MEPNACNLDRFFRLVEHLTQSPHLCRFVVELRLSVFYFSNDIAFNDHNQLITLLPSLKELRLTTPPPHLSLPIFKQLKTLRFDFLQYSKQYKPEISDLERVDPLEIVARHFWIPTLQNLEISAIRLHRGRRSRLFPKQRYRTSPITNLRVMRCNYDDLDILPDILLSVRALKRFTLESRVSASEDDLPDNYISPDWFARTLQPHESTLVDLAIAGSDAAFFLRMPLFGSFTSFINLTRLAIPETFLVQRHSFTLHEWLPPSLEVLQLQIPLGCNRDLDEEQPLRFEKMEHLAENKLACLPALKCVIWWIQYHEDQNINYLQNDEERISRFDQLTHSFEEVGVKFRLCPSAFWYYLEDAWSNERFYNEISPLH